MQLSSHHDDPVQKGAKPPPSAPGDFTQRQTVLIAIGLIGVATTGYFLGLTSPMMAGDERPSDAAEAVQTEEHPPASSTVIPATAYAEMPFVQTRSRRLRATRLNMLRQTPYDVNVKIDVNEAEKLASLADRETRRAFDGAPPTVPHPIDQLDSTACMACHGEGLRSGTFRASKMPHPYYSSCTQCHVEQNAKFAPASATFENSFTGVAAPTSGGRASQGATPTLPYTDWMRKAIQNRDPATDWVPPVFPHTTWMRNDCLSCHGRTAAPGMESTHPWQANCLRCHGKSPQLNPTELPDVPKFLSSPAILDSDE
ncbi:MAG: hypothetical protein GXP24_14560 [Planctomycetes bacterium]|nr:hypothetical protein [Planctomycetota bacterium]